MNALPSLPKLASRLDHGGAVLRLTLDAPPGNVLDSTMTSSLRQAVCAARDLPELRLIVFTGAGRHFSFGASVEEHRPEKVGAMLAGFHGFFRELIETDVPTLALVNGQCLGGGLELAAFCDWVFALDNAHLGQPEIKLGVFAPVGSIVLPWRCGAKASDLLLTGRSVDARTAEGLGLANRVLPETEAEERLDTFIREDLLPLSASSVRRARKAARWHLHRQMKHGLPELESLYLEDLMATPDATEGILAFLEKRPPKWTHKERF
jgi:cyclohexa-1,5-dienecarbonyl-CoA hydratase